MVHRIDKDADALRFTGLLDVEAFRRLRERCASEGVRRLRLAAGTEGSPELIEALLTLEVELVADAPHLARWLERVRAARGS